MPCDTQQYSVIELGKNTDAESMMAAFKELKLNPVRSGQVIYFNGGEYHTTLNKLTLGGSNAENRTKEIKRSYMAEATKKEAKRFGFQGQDVGRPEEARD